MAGSQAIWGIEIGQCALKAVKVRPAGDGRLEAVAFDVIEHAKILSQPDAEPEELIKAALDKFVSRNQCQGDRFVIGVPGQQTFARFCKLPPADPKKINDLVQYEASQQIPFDMEDVVWDFQTFANPNSPEVEVGIFAMRKDLIRKQIDYYSAVKVAPVAVQTIPSALYNFCRFELGDKLTGGAVVLIDVGAQNTDLIIVEPSSAWTRNIPLGGNSFTETLVRAFKLPFAKAETLKRQAASSKYARQIFQAMRPVFADLVAEIQRSIGFYSSTHREVELKQVVAVGNAFLLPGLQKYLENNLTISGGVLRMEQFEKLVAAEGVDAEQFAANVLTLGAAYGLAVQGLGLGTIKASLLPPELARIAVWKKKQPWFAIAAACLAAAALCPYARTVMDRQALAGNSATRERVESIKRNARDLQNKYRATQQDTGAKMDDINKLLDIQKEKRLVPNVIALLNEAMPETDARLKDVRGPEELKKLIQSDPGRLARTQRKQMMFESVQIDFVSDVETAEFGKTGSGGPAGMSVTGKPKEAGSNPGFTVNVVARLLYGQTPPEAASVITEEFYANLRRLAKQPGRGFFMPEPPPEEKSVAYISNPRFEQFSRPTGSGGGGFGSPGAPSSTDPKASELTDPVTGESTATDWRIEFSFKVKLGEPPAPPPDAAAPPAKPPGR
ncbi:Competence protein A [Phycisphaerae bacterium RAS1]|nr:Competence protein A [Phycisphaerae bacterium RAS1]